jgi:hypothetical protein
VVSSKRKTWVISVEMQPIPTYSNQEKAPGTPSGNNSETRTASPAPFAMHLASRPPQVKIRDLALRLVVLCLLPTSDNPQLRAFKQRKRHDSRVGTFYEVYEFQTFAPRHPQGGSVFGPGMDSIKENTGN